MFRCKVVQNLGLEQKATEYAGNKELLNLPKVGFLATRRVPSGEVMKCYDWAVRQAMADGCVVSGFSSQIERDVLNFLLQGGCPVIVVLARRMYKTLPAEWQQAVDAGRMLVASITEAPRQSRQTATQRNLYVAGLCDTVFLAGLAVGSSLYEIKQAYPEKCKSISA